MVGLAHLCLGATKAAPPFAIFEGWEQRTSIPCHALLTQALSRAGKRTPED